MEIDNENYLYYLPSDFINSNYIYSIQDDYITINKRTNCYTQYNSTYCDCLRVYPSFNYLSSDTYSCSTSMNYTINSSKFTSNVFDSPNFYQLFIIYFIIIFIFSYILKLLYNVFRKRSV